MGIRIDFLQGADTGAEPVTIFFQRISLKIIIQTIVDNKAQFVVGRQRET